MLHEVSVNVPTSLSNVANLSPDNNVSTQVPSIQASRIFPDIDNFNHNLPYTNKYFPHKGKSEEGKSVKERQYRYHKYSRDTNSATEQFMMKTTMSSKLHNKMITKSVQPEPDVQILSNIKLSMTDNTALFLRKRRFILDTPFSIRSTISYGFIVYAKDTGRWAITRRKHSVEFLLFIRGLYRLTYLSLILSCITEEEASIIFQCLKEGPDKFKTIYLEELELSPDGLDYALVRIAESRNIAVNLLSRLNLSKNNLSWTWPKGRLHISSNMNNSLKESLSSENNLSNESKEFVDESSSEFKSISFNRETPFDCARREFIEEVEITLPSPLFISDTYVSENIKTITGRNIESRYWIYVIPNEIPMTPPKSHPEVSDRMWTDTEQCRKLMRHETLFEQVINMISSIIDS